MKFTVEQIAARLPDLRAAAIRERLPLGPARIAHVSAGSPPGTEPAQPGYDDSAWQTLAVGDRWGGPGQTWWLRVPFRVPPAWAGQRVALRVQLGEYDEITGPEALAYLDGAPIQGFDFHHRELLLSALGDRLRLDAPSVAGEAHLLALEAYSSLLPGPQTLRALELLRIDAEAEALYHDLRVLHGALLTMPPDALDRARLLHALERAYNLLDLRRPQSDEYLRSVAQARALLRQEVWGTGKGNLNEGTLPDQPHIAAAGHAHIDLAWLWPVAQTRRKGARTFSGVLRLMEQYPQYHFVASQPALYQMVKDDEPAIYAALRERIAEGRWEPTGATWVEMDCNLAGGEALVRQFLLGKRFFRDELGVDPRLLFLPDVFGYSAALPQIMRGCGVEYFMTTKISWNEYNRLPYDTFRWRGLDGSEVLTHMVTAPLDPAIDTWNGARAAMYTYNAKGTPYDLAGAWARYQQKPLNDEVLYLFGYGDGGGGPTATMQETLTRLGALPGFPQVRQGSVEEFFRRLERRVGAAPDLPTWVGELYLEYHRGTYTSQGWVKRANRSAELLYREAELWGAWQHLLAPIPSAGEQAAWQAELNRGWRSILFNQFHDILPGSSITQVYSDARTQYTAIFARGEPMRDDALDRLAAAVAAGPAAEQPALVVYNPAPFAREDAVEIALPDDTPLPALADDHGQPLAFQALPSHEAGTNRALLAASAPPLGYRCYSAADGTARAAGTGGAGGALQISREVLENRYYRLRLDKRGQIASLYDKRAEREVIASGAVGNRLIAFEDRPLAFDAWDINLYYVDKAYPLDAVESWRIVESGPLRGGVEVVRRYGASTITQRILLHRDLPRIDFPTEVDWHEHQTLLKVAFPVAVQSLRATFDIQWGNVERPTHWNTSWDWARFESCAHKWIDLSEGDYGVSLLNDCKYGHDVRGSTLSLTLIKSGIYPDPEADQGAHAFTYALLPHLGDWRAGETVRHAYLLNMPAQARLVAGSRPATQPASQPTLPRAASLVATDRPGLVIETVKPAEDGDGLIVRLYDAHNTRGPATLTFAQPIASAEETNLLEERIGPASVAENTLHLTVRPYGISTFRVRLAGA